MMNLLTDPVFRVETPDGQERLSLPQLLEALGLDRVESLPGLQRHQEDAFHIFLCYLAGAVLARESQTDPCQNAEFWLEGIRRLTEAHVDSHLAHLSSHCRVREQRESCSLTRQ